MVEEPITAGRMADRMNGRCERLYHMAPGLFGHSVGVASLPVVPGVLAAGHPAVQTRHDIRDEVAPALALV